MLASSTEFNPYIELYKKGIKEERYWNGSRRCVLHRDQDQEHMAFVRELKPKWNSIDWCSMSIKTFVFPFTDNIVEHMPNVILITSPFGHGQMVYMYVWWMPCSLDCSIKTYIINWTEKFDQLLILGRKKSNITIKEYLLSRLLLRFWFSLTPNSRFGFVDWIWHTFGFDWNQQFKIQHASTVIIYWTIFIE